MKLRNVKKTTLFNCTDTEVKLYYAPFKVKAACPIPDGEIFTLSVWRQEYLMKIIFY